MLRSTLSIIVRRCLKSLKVKSEASIKVQEMEYTYSSVLDDKKLIYCDVLFLTRVYCKAAKISQRKKKSLQCYRALSDNCMENKMFVSRNDRSK